MNFQSIFQQSAAFCSLLSTIQQSDTTLKLTKRIRSGNAVRHKSPFYIRTDFSSAAGMQRQISEQSATAITLDTFKKRTYVPYSGVMRVALPVACKGKETGSDTVEAAGRMTSLTFSHTHQRKQEKVYTEHIPLAHGSAKCGGSSQGICLQWTRFIEYSGLG